MVELGKRLKIDNMYFVWSYEDKIGLLFTDELQILNQFKNYSVSTTKHINKVAEEYKVPIKYVDKLERL